MDYRKEFKKEFRKQRKKHPNITKTALKKIVIDKMNEKEKKYNIFQDENEIIMGTKKEVKF